MLIAIISDSMHLHEVTVHCALQTGYQVIGLTLQPEKLRILHPNLQVVQGDPEDPTAVGHLLQDAHAVICLFHKQTNAAIRNIITHMQHRDIRRGIFFSEHLVDALPTPSRRLFSRHTSSPGSADIISASQRDWTIIRPYDDERLQTAHHHFDISGHSLERIKENFAKCILGQIADSTYIAKVVTV